MFILILIIILAIFFINQVFLAIVNPEILLFSEKLGGNKAKIYLITNALIGVLPIALFLRGKYQIGIILAIIYFGYNLYWIYISYHTVGIFLILSFVVSILTIIFFKLEK